MKSIAIYLRVSTVAQDVASQEPDLEQWLTAYGKGLPVRRYCETASGKTMQRPELQRLERDCQRGLIGTVAVWRLDRLGRTAAGIIALLESFDASGIQFVSLRDGIDSSTPAGRLMRNVLASVAAYEREVTRERVMAGVARAKAAGKTWGGRKPGYRPVLTEEKLRAIQGLLHSGIGKAEIARQLGIGERTVYKAMKLLEKP